ncbi:MAG: helix-turn-helix transcriptional regulator [Lachnospiraceae bacterium]|nr:helix-turn-helix transcriptional regulator [Lachnospiraceae bacterium]
MDISKKLREVRENKGLSIEELAEIAGKGIDSIKGWEDGSITPSASDLIDLSKAYEMTMDEMLYKDVEPPAYDDEEGAYMNGIMPVSKKGKRKISFTKGEKITLMVFPVLCIIVFLILGIFMGLWNPGWIVFIMIPIYYGLVLVLRIVGNNVDDAIDEYIDEK